MASTSKNWTGVNSWVSCRLVVTSTPNTNGNYSDVTATLYGARNDGGTSYNQSSSNFWININGTKTTRTSACTVAGTGWTQVHKQTTRVYHNSDGSKSISISAGGEITGTSFQMGSASVSLTLDKIARKSDLSVNNGTLGTALTLTIDRKASGYTDTIKYTCGSASGTICEKTSETTVSFTPPLDLAKQNTTGTAVSIEFAIETFNGTTSLGTNKKTISCEIPSSIVPTVSFTHKDVFGYLDTYGKYIQGKSRVQVEITASGSYGSTIKEIKTNVDNKTYLGDSFISDPLVGYGTLTIYTTVTDSRGRTATSSQAIQVYAYSVPKISAISAKRSDVNGISSSSGKYLAVTFSAEITSLDNKNTADFSIQYKKTGDVSYISDNMTSFDGQYSVTNGVFVFEADISSKYDITLTVTDAFGSIPKSTIGGTAKKLWSFFKRGLGIAFGKVAEEENLAEFEFNVRCNNIATFKGPVQGKALGMSTLIEIPSNADLNNYTEPGCYGIPQTVTAQTISNIPTQAAGRLYCFACNAYEGASNSALQYREQWYIPLLFGTGSRPAWKRYMETSSGTTYTYGPWYNMAIDAYPVGSIYIAYDGTSPASRFGGTWTRIESAFLYATSADASIGETGGESTHKLTVSEMPSHTHAQNVTANSGGASQRKDWDSDGKGIFYAQGCNTNATGGGGAHNNMPPYVKVAIWRRTA